MKKKDLYLAALKTSITHWEENVQFFRSNIGKEYRDEFPMSRVIEIVDGNDGIGYGADACACCDAFDDCMICPVELFGRGCGEGSSWDDFDSSACMAGVITITLLEKAEDVLKSLRDVYVKVDEKEFD